MGYKGTIKSVLAAYRRAEREEAKRIRRLQKEQKQFDQMQEQERARFAVSQYENLISFLLSFHKDCGPTIDWYSIRNSAAPEKPIYDRTSEFQAQRMVDNYKPGFIAKRLGMAAKKKAQLEDAVKAGIKADQVRNQKNLKLYQTSLSEWKEMNEVAVGVLKKDCKAYSRAFRLFDPFSELSGIGTKCTLKISPNCEITINVAVNDNETIPKESLTLLKSGKLSKKPLPKGKYRELYQDHVCSALIRIARETFALLPEYLLIVNAESNLLNPKTGHHENTTIISVAFSRAKLSSLNTNSIDCSDAIENFVHRMNFRKTKGFSKVEPLSHFEFG